MLKKLLSALLALLLICGILPSFALADEFDPRAKAHIPVYMDGTVEAGWNGETKVFTVTVNSEISKREWAYLYQYYSNDTGTKLLLDYETDVPEGTADCIFCSPSNGYTFENFQNDYQSIGDYEDGTEGFDCFSLDGDRHMGSRLFIAECSLDSGNVTITPREDSYEEYYAWLNESGNAISYSNIKYEFTPECGEATFSEEELLSEKFNEHRIRLEDEGFFEDWKEEELIQGFKDGDFKVEVLYPGDVDGEEIERKADFSKSIDCEFVDGILEITLHKMTPELLEKTFDINSDTQGTFFIRLKITLPDGTQKMKLSQGNGRFGEAKELLNEIKELGSEDKVTYCYVDAGRFVRDGGIVNYFPEEDSGLFGCFIGYTTDNTNVKQRALMTYVTAAEDSKPVSFANPHNITPVGVSQIEVDKTYDAVLSGEKDGEPNYDPETGTLTYVYKGEKTTPDEIAADLKEYTEGQLDNVKTFTTIHAPEGYVLKGTYDKDGELIKEVDGKESKTEVKCHFGEDGSIINVNSHWTFVWKSESKWDEEDSPENLLLQEMYITNDFGVQLTFYDIYWEAPAENRIEIYSEDLKRVVGIEELKEKGINVNIDEHGRVRTTFDLNADIGYFGRCFAFIRPPEGAKWCKTSNGGGNVDLPRYNQREADELKRTLGRYEFEPIQTGDKFYQMHSYPVCIPDKAEIETPDGNSITVWYTAFISVENFVVEWYGEDEEGEPAERIEGNFLYGSMDDLSYVQETEEIEEDELDEHVVYPTIVKSNGKSKNRKLWSKKNPQDSGSGSVMIELKELGEIDPNETKCIFIPLEYIDYDGEWGEGRVDFVVRHFEGCEGLTELEEAAKNGSGVKVDCEYNEFGLYIYTNTFSPFVITCNAVEPEKNHRYSNTVVIGAKNTDEKKAEEENPDTGAPVLSMSTGIVLAGIALVLAKRK